MLGDRSFVLHQRAKAAQNPQTSHFVFDAGASAISLLTWQYPPQVPLS
jgi:hypothetical protein